MAGLAGICNLDGHHALGNISPGSSTLCTAPESFPAKQPFYDEASGLSIVMDGRIDNRDELIAALDSSLRAATDAELALRAYQRWADDSPRRLLGDFAYALWDSRARTLFCARDHLGIRPFCYWTDGRVFLFASEVGQILAHPAVPRHPNEGMVAEVLSGDLASMEETLYQGILRLPPAHSLKADASGIRLQRYWDIDPARQLRCDSDADYAARFRSVFQEAVRCRLRSDGPIACELSGGLDSSAVVAMVRHLTPGAFDTLSLVFPGLDCDESSYQQQVAGFCRTRPNYLPVDPDPLWYAACAARHLDLPDYPNFHMTEVLAVCARQKGIRTVLTGQGGDHWCSVYLPVSRPLRAWRRLRAEPGLATLGAITRGIWRALQPPVPPNPWIPAGFARRVALQDRLRRPPASLPFSTPTHRALYSVLNDALVVHCQELQDRAGARFDIEHRHPFHDRRLIELAFSLPEDQICRRGRNKFILRQAMQGLLPGPVIERTSKAEFSGVSAQLFESPEIAPLFHSSLIAQQGWIDQEQVSILYREFMAQWRRGRTDGLPHVWPLSLILGVELWFRAAFADRIL